MSPGSARYTSSAGVPFPSSYHYSTSFVGKPDLWTEDAAADPEYLRPARLHQIASPSQKALLWDAELGWFERQSLRDDLGNLNVPSPTAFADGSVATRLHTNATEPNPNPFEHPRNQLRLHNTPNGVKGRDY